MNHHLIATLGWTLLHFVWEGLAIAIVLAITLYALKKRSANLRYAVSCAALTLMAACPVVTFLVVNSTAATPLTPQQVAAIQIYAKGVTLVPEPASPLSAALKVIEPFLPNLVLIWVVGMALLSLRMIGGLVEIERLKKRFASPASAEWQARLDDIAGRLGIRRNVQLLETTKIEVPSAMGLFKATVMVPCSALIGLPTDELEALFAHELAHIRRHDYLVNLLQTVVETTLFYHPAVWWASKVIRVEREHCCDDIAVRAMGDPIVYARALTALEEQRAFRPQLTLAANGGSLMNRIRRILGLSSSPNKLALTWIPCLAVLALLLPLGSFAQNKQDEKKKDGPEISIESKRIPGVRKSMKKAFHDIMSDPDGVVYIDGVRKKVKDMTPAERRKLEADLDKAGEEADKAIAEAQEVTQKTLREVFAKGGPVQKSMELAMGSLKDLKIPDIDSESINAEIAKGFAEADKEMAKAQKEGWKDSDKQDMEAERSEALADAAKERAEAMRNVEQSFREQKMSGEEMKKAMAEARKGLEEARKEMAKAREEARKQGKDGEWNMKMPDIDKILESVSKGLENMHFEMPEMNFNFQDLPKAPHTPNTPNTPMTLRVEGMPGDHMMTKKQMEALKKQIQEMVHSQMQLTKVQREEIRKQMQELRKQMKQMHFERDKTKKDQGSADEELLFVPRDEVSVVRAVPGPYVGTLLSRMFVQPQLSVAVAPKAEVLEAPKPTPAIELVSPPAKVEPKVSHKPSWSLLSFIPYPLNKWSPL